jgi:hypothetical protein
MSLSGNSPWIRSPNEDTINDIRNKDALYKSYHSIRFSLVRASDRCLYCKAAFKKAAAAAQNASP